MTTHSKLHAKLRHMLLECLLETIPGLDAILFVLNKGDRFTPELQEIQSLFFEWFGEGVDTYAHLVLTHCNTDNEALQYLTKDSHNLLLQLAHRCGNRVIPINNIASETKTVQGQNLVKRIKEVRRKNRDRSYIDEKYAVVNHIALTRDPLDISLDSLNIMAKVEPGIIRLLQSNAYEFIEHNDGIKREKNQRGNLQIIDDTLNKSGLFHPHQSGANEHFGRNMSVKSHESYCEYTLKDISHSASSSDESKGGSHVQSNPRRCKSVKSRDTYREDSSYYKSDSAASSDEYIGGSHVQSNPRRCTSLKSRDTYREDSSYDKSDSAASSDESKGGSHVQSNPCRCMPVKSRDTYREDSSYDKSDSALLSDESESGSHVQLNPRRCTSVMSCDSYRRDTLKDKSDSVASSDESEGVSHVQLNPRRCTSVKFSYRRNTFKDESDSAELSDESEGESHIQSNPLLTTDDTTDTKNGEEQRRDNDAGIKNGKVDKKIRLFRRMNKNLCKLGYTIRDFLFKLVLSVCCCGKSFTEVD